MWSGCGLDAVSFDAVWMRCLGFENHISTYTQNIDVETLTPRIRDSYFSSSVTKQAREMRKPSGTLGLKKFGPGKLEA